MKQQKIWNKKNINFEEDGKMTASELNVIVFMQQCKMIMKSKENMKINSYKKTKKRKNKTK